jgi:hypothetical protein
VIFGGFCPVTVGCPAISEYWNADIFFRIWFLLWPTITAVLWILSSELFVQFTGSV